MSRVAGDHLTAAGWLLLPLYLIVLALLPLADVHVDILPYHTPYIQDATSLPEQGIIGFLHSIFSAHFGDGADQAIASKGLLTAESGITGLSDRTAPHADAGCAVASSPDILSTPPSGARTAGSTAGPRPSDGFLACSSGLSPPTALL